jgi:hypothetical protein
MASQRNSWRLIKFRTPFAFEWKDFAALSNTMETTIPVEHIMIIKSFRFIPLGTDTTTF